MSTIKFQVDGYLENGFPVEEEDIETIIELEYYEELIELIEEGNEETVHAYALTAKMFGFRALYLEAGSGASSQVDANSIKSARLVEELCLIVGGGIRTGEQAALAAKSGANWVVTGTLTEDASSMEELKQRVSQIVNAIQSSSS